VNPTYDFDGQVAVVTGASSGMGLDTVRAFAAAGAAVVLADVNENALRAATDELTAAGHQALGVRCDVADEDQVAALVDRTVDTFGRLDCPAGPRTTPASTASSASPRAPRWSTHRAASASMPCAPGRSRRRWSTR
jgi:hypothetical protein